MAHFYIYRLCHYMCSLYTMNNIYILNLIFKTFDNVSFQTIYDILIFPKLCLSNTCIVTRE